MSEKTSSGISLMSLLGVAFIILKLVGKISWSWWWVTAPLWGPPLFLIVVLVIVGTVAAVVD